MLFVFRKHLEKMIILFNLKYFFSSNIPIIFYFNGTHADYHRPSDTPDKINYELLENRTRLVFHTAWEVANRETRITADKVEVKKEETSK